MSKIILLDFDGVVIPFTKKYQKMHPALPSLEAVATLNAIIKETGAKIVVTSAWRLFATIEALDACIKKWGVVGDVIGKAPHLPSDSRGLEILSWLQDSSGKTEEFVVIDDEASEMILVDDHFIKVQDPKKGLLLSDASAIIKILEGNITCA